MVASGILFKEEFDMSTIDKVDMIQFYNPEDCENEDIGDSIVKRTRYNVDNNYALVSYESKNEEILEHIFEVSDSIQKALPKLYKCEKINENLVLAVYPFYEVDFDESEDDEDYYELNEKIENTLKEFARVYLYLDKISFTKEEALSRLKEYAESFYKFYPDSIDFKEVDLGDFDEFEKKLKELFDNLNKQDNDNDDNGEDSES